MFSEACYLQTSDGLVFPKDGKVEAWSGDGWSDYELSSESNPVICVETADGCLFKATADARMVVAGVEHYITNSVAKLKAGDSLCIASHASDKALFAPFSRQDYWLGHVYAQGLLTKNKAALPIKTKRKAFDKAAADNAERVLGSYPLRINTHVERRGGTDYVVMSGPRLEAWLASCGLRFRTDGNQLWAPASAYIGSVTARKAFCRGVMDSIGEAYKDNWYVRFSIQSQALEFTFLLKCLGIEITTIESTCVVPRWIASLYLGTSTFFPPKRLLTSKPSPLDAYDNFMLGCQRFLNNKHRLHGMAKYVHTLISNGINVHPEALRAAWMALELRATDMLYNYQTVIRTYPETCDIITTKATGLAETLALSGNVLWTRM